MKKAIIVAMAKNNVIGRNNALPWNIPADLKRFKKITTGDPVIMGRKTFESIGKSLPNRENLIITSQPDKIIDPNVKAFSSIEEAVGYCEERQYPQLFFIGGASLYEKVIDSVDQIYLTSIDAEVDGDVYFPEIDYKKFTVKNIRSGFSSKYEYYFIDLEKKA
jgi:dihydrofolate reductase